MDFTRRVEAEPAFDLRSPDPNHDRGIHGVTLRFIVARDRRAVVFLLFTNWYLPHVAVELADRPDAIALLKPIPAEVGYHSPEPLYDGQKLLIEDCPYTGGACYSDGSFLSAVQAFETLVTGGTTALWAWLDNRWRETFEVEEEA